VQRSLAELRYEGAWRLTQLEAQTAVTYELTAEPSFDVPGFTLKRRLRRDSAQMIERLQREIEARALSLGRHLTQNLLDGIELKIDGVRVEMVDHFFWSPGDAIFCRVTRAGLA
jgi:hypothetical protein